MIYLYVISPNVLKTTRSLVITTHDINTVFYRTQTLNLRGSVDKIHTIYELVWGKFVFIFINLWLKMNIFFNNECRQQTTTVLTVSQILALIEITDIFISQWNCSYLEIFTLTTTSKLWTLLDILLNIIV